MTTNYDATTFNSKQEQDAFNQACDEKETLTQPTKKEAPTMNVTVFTNQKEKYLPAWTKKCTVYNDNDEKGILRFSNEVYAQAYHKGHISLRTPEDRVIVVINSQYFNLFNYTGTTLAMAITNLISVGNHVDIYDLYSRKTYRCTVPSYQQVLDKWINQAKFLATKYNKINSEFYKKIFALASKKYGTTNAKLWDTPTVDFSISNYILQDVMLDIQQDRALAELIVNSAYTPVEHCVTESELYEHDIIPNSVEVPDWHVQVNKEVTTFDRSKADRSKCVINSVYFTDHNFNYSQQRVVTNKDMAIAQQHYEYLASHGLLEPTRDEKESRYTELKELLFTTSREDVLADIEYYFNLLVEYQELEAELGEFVTSFFNLTF